MTAPAFDAPTAPRQEFERGQWDRPKIKPAPPLEVWADENGRTSAFRLYQRVTTAAGALDDSYGLIDWSAAQALLGVSRRQDYLMAAASMRSWDEDKGELRKLVAKCKEAAGDNAADLGSALHRFTERMDRGQDVGNVPEPYRPHLERYAQLAAPLRFTHVEVPTVCDPLQLAGTPDRLGYCSIPDPDGVVDTLRVIDTKSGKLGPGVLKMSAQLSVYAHSDLYDVRTGERTPVELDDRWGLILHLPAKASAAEVQAGAGDLYWLRLDHGWAGMGQASDQPLAVAVQAWRKVKPEQLLVPVTAPAAAEPAVDLGREASRHAITAAITTRDLAQLWQESGGTWDQELQELAAVRHAELQRLEQLRAPRAALLGALAAATEVELRELWDKHAGTDLWTDEASAAAEARYKALSVAA